MHLSLEPLVPVIKVCPKEIIRDLNNDLVLRCSLQSKLQGPKTKQNPETTLMFNNKKMLN